MLLQDLRANLKMTREPHSDLLSKPKKKKKKVRKRISKKWRKKFTDF
jgi:hypothetical protein